MIVTLGILDFVPGFLLFLLIFRAFFTLLIIPKAFIELDFRLIQQSLPGKIQNYPFSVPQNNIVSSLVHSERKYILTTVII